jgi:hypothetical protein
VFRSTINYPKEVFAYARAQYHTLLNQSKQSEQSSKHIADALQMADALAVFLAPLLCQLDALIDKRLVRTFFATLVAIVQLRNRACGLLLSELGGYILSPHQAPAGTKRVSNLLRSAKWHYSLIDQFTLQQANNRVEKLVEQGEDVLLVWDESELEKSESIELEGLCAVRSLKAARLKRHKPGFHRPPPGPPVFVPGMHWLGLLVVGLSEKSGPPMMAAMRWWTTRGGRASERRTQEWLLMRECAHRWGRGVLHIFDRGFAGAPWVEVLFDYWVLFVMRWPLGYKLLDEQGRERAAWQITRGKRSWDQRLLWDSHQRKHRKTGVVASQVRHPSFPAQPLWLVVSRPGKGRKPWYLLTNEPVLSKDDAWRVVLSYARRWQVEMSFRYQKSELAMESPRLWRWDNRLKLLLMVSLVYAFLLSLLEPAFALLLARLLRGWCHRSGKRYRDASIPLYRLRSALSRLWLAYSPPTPPLFGLNSG